MNKRDRAKADAAYRKMFEAPLGDGVIRGQLDALSEDVAGVARLPERYGSDDVPPTCPGCLRVQTVQRGWTAMRRDSFPGLLPALQCGGCGRVVLVSQHAFDQVAQQNRAAFGASDVPPEKPSRAPKQRGAG